MSLCMCVLSISLLLQHLRCQLQNTVFEIVNDLFTPMAHTQLCLTHSIDLNWSVPKMTAVVFVSIASCYFRQHFFE